MPPLAKVPKAEVISRGVTTEAPRPRAGAGSSSERMPVRLASSTTSGGPTWVMRLIEEMLRELARALRKVMRPRNLPS